MDSFAYLQNITIDDILMVVLTGIIAWSVLWQARYTKRLAEISVQSEQRALERSKPEIRFAQRNLAILSGDIDKSFVGFSVTNASPFDVTITSFNLSLGMPAEITEDCPIMLSLMVYHVDQYRGRPLSDFSLPRRLSYGESMLILYDEDEAISALKYEGKGRPLRIQPQCEDSLGNHHTMDCWIDWNRKPVATFSDPGPGRITEEQWRDQLAKSRPSMMKNNLLRAVYTRMLSRLHGTA